MKVNVKEIKKQFNLKAGDLVVLQDGSTRLLISQYVDDRYALLCMETGSICSGRAYTVKELLEYVDNPIVRVIPSSRLELRELD